ncbi:MAG: integrase [Planctomycetaceae bacterium]|nr:integrase [Planctomycetaceae bacterium]
MPKYDDAKSNGGVSDQRQLIRSFDAIPPAFGGQAELTTETLRSSMGQAVRSWLGRTSSEHTRVNYARDLRQFLKFVGIKPRHLEELISVRPEHVSAWRDHLQNAGAANSTMRRKLTVLRSLFSYLQVYGYLGANPAHSKFVKAPSVSRDGKTVGLSPADCRQLIDAPDPDTPVGIRDRAILGVLAYSACRVGELVRLRLSDFKTSGEHRVLNVFGKGGKERTVPLHLEAVERLTAWIEAAGISDDRDRPLFCAAKTPRGKGRDGFAGAALTTRSVEYLVKRYAHRLGLDPAVTVHSLRVTALTTARERGADIIDLQDFAGHADPRTTLAYIRSRDRLSKSPAYVLNY